MDIGKIVYLTLQGFFFGYGPCFLTCAPIILPYVGTKRTWKEGFLATLSFSMGRLAVYMILGGLFGYFGAFILRFYYASGFFYYIQTVVSVILISLGVAVLLGKETSFRFCGTREGNMALLGVMVGLSPCLPLIGVLLEIALLSDGFLTGAAYSFFFGIGTVISPMLLIGSAIPLIGGRIDKKAFKVFTYICGLMMVIIGLYLLLRGGAPNIKV